MGRVLRLAVLVGVGAVVFSKLPSETRDRLTHLGSIFSKYVKSLG